MKQRIKLFAIGVVALFFQTKIQAQGIHFSQHYNAPMLQNAANTALMPENNYRIGFNYRSQWAAVPVPYTTTSFFGDVQLLKDREYSNGWLGLGFAFFNDKAGDGILALNSTKLFLAYHLLLGQNAVLSVGFSGAYNQRSVDYSRLTFDTQWDGMTFNTQSPNGEPYSALMKARYLDVGAGANLSIFPNENFYMKIGAGLNHLNNPKESFYGQNNRLGMRPTATLDIMAKANEKFIVSPSVYYTHVRGASEFIIGSQYMGNIASNDNTVVSLLFGTYYRWGDAFILTAGMDLNNARLVVSYDITFSQMKEANRTRGAFEIALIYEGKYHRESVRNLYNCPRF